MSMFRSVSGVALLEQAVGIVETIAAGLDANDSHEHVRSLVEELGLVLLSERSAKAAADDLWEGDRSCGGCRR